MAPFQTVPKDVYPLIAVVAAGLTCMAHSGYHALVHSPEVHVSKPQRSDELLETPGLAEKGAAVRARSAYAAVARFGRHVSLPDLWPTQPEHRGD
jgi:hypothetical protein